MIPSLHAEYFHYTTSQTEENFIQAAEEVDEFFGSFGKPLSTESRHWTWDFHQERYLSMVRTILRVQYRIGPKSDISQVAELARTLGPILGAYRSEISTTTVEEHTYPDGEVKP